MTTLMTEQPHKIDIYRDGGEYTVRYIRRDRAYVIEATEPHLSDALESLSENMTQGGVAYTNLKTRSRDGS